LRTVPLNRREALAALSAPALATLMSACGTNRDAPAAADALLDAAAEHLLQRVPESATSLGLDKGAHAALRSQLADRSAEGQQQLAAQRRDDLNRVKAVDVSGLSDATRTSFEVVRSAYATALEGFTLPYGDVAVGGWRNTP